MTLPPGWPLGLPYDMAERYENGARELYSTKLFRDLRRFDLGLNIALNCCEAARRHQWPEVSELERKRRLVEEWPGAAAGAKKVAAALEKANGHSGTFMILDAAKQAGLTLSADKRLNVAIADFLREISSKRLRIGRGGGSYVYGSIRISRDKGERSSWPSRTVVLVVSVGHLLRLVAESKPRRELTISSGQPIVRIEGWNAAAAFAQGAGLERGEQIGDVRAAAERWRNRHKGRLSYIGWKAPEDRSREK